MRCPGSFPEQAAFEKTPEGSEGGSFASILRNVGRAGARARREKRVQVVLRQWGRRAGQLSIQKRRGKGRGIDDGQPTKGAHQAIERLFALLLLLLYVRACACVYMRVTHTCACIREQKRTLSVFHLLFSVFLSWERVSSWTGSFPFWLECLAMEHSGSACLYPPILGFQTHKVRHSKHLTQMLDSLIQFLMLVKCMLLTISPGFMKSFGICS